MSTFLVFRIQSEPIDIHKIYKLYKIHEICIVHKVYKIYIIISHNVMMNIIYIVATWNRKNPEAPAVVHLLSVTPAAIDQLKKYKNSLTFNKFQNIGKKFSVKKINSISSFGHSDIWLGEKISQFFWPKDHLCLDPPLESDVEGWYGGEDEEGEGEHHHQVEPFYLCHNLSISFSSSADLWLVDLLFSC